MAINQSITRNYTIDFTNRNVIGKKLKLTKQNIYELSIIFNFG